MSPEMALFGLAGYGWRCPHIGAKRTSQNPRSARDERLLAYWWIWDENAPFQPELRLAKRPPRMSVIGRRAENICSF
jgi:hypothetical protein